MYVVSDCTYPLCQKSQRFFGAHTIHYDLGEDSEAGVDSEGIASVCLFCNYHLLDLRFVVTQSNWHHIFCWSHVGGGFIGLAKIQKVSYINFTSTS